MRQPWLKRRRSWRCRVRAHSLCSCCMGHEKTVGFVSSSRYGPGTVAAAVAAAHVVHSAAASPVDSETSVPPAAPTQHDGIARWVSSERHRGLMIPRFLECEGHHWDPVWSVFRTRLNAEPPSEMIRSGRAPSVQLATLADGIVAGSDDDEYNMRGYHLFARRVARDLGFAEGAQAGPSAAYDTRTAASDGFVSDAVLSGFCLYGLVAALFVKALHVLAIAGEAAAEIAGNGPDSVSALAAADDMFVQAARIALDHVRIAIGLVGPHLGMDFMESSSWNVHSSDIRRLTEGLESVLAFGRYNITGAAQVVSWTWPPWGDWEKGSPWWQPPLQAPSKLNPPMEVHLAIALADADSPTVKHLSLSEEASSAFLWERLAARFLDGSNWEAAVDPVLSVVGLGDHATATLDAALMVQKAIRGVADHIQVRMGLHGLACPAEVAGRHHCRLRCHVLDIPCGPTTDPLAEWLGRYVMENEGGGGYAMQGDAAAASLAAALVGLGDALTSADLLVCSHPVSMCFLAFALLWRGVTTEEGVSAPLLQKPMLIHIASTLLYGAPGCSECAGRLRRYDTQAARDYMNLVRELLTGPVPLLALTEGAVLSAQLQLQLGVKIASVPPLALYLDDKSRWFGRDGAEPIGEKRHTVLVTRARLFAHPAGFFLRCLLQEIAISNQPVADAARGHFWFAESLDKAEGEPGSEDSWKSWDEMASCQAAFFIPSDMHQRTFVELYRMHVPTFMPDSEWLLKLPLIAPFGLFAYDGGLPNANNNDQEQEDWMSEGRPLVFFDSEDAAAVRAVYHWYHYSDYAHFPHVVRCSSIPDLLIRLADADFVEMAGRMRSHYELLVRGATVAFAQAAGVLLTPQANAR